MSKLFITGITQSGEINNLRELLDPLYPYYDGLQWTFHYPKDEGADYLESIKKEGKIIYANWVQRLDWARNHCLYEGTMKTGDFFLILDSKERLYPKFFELWPQLKQFLESNNIDGVVLGGKRFLYRFNEFLEFRGNPHEGLAGGQRVIDLLQLEQYKNPDWFWKNVHKDPQRDKYHYIGHFLKYITFPNSNHAMLGNENNTERYKKEKMIGLQFRLYLEYNNLLPITIDKFKWLCENKLNEIKPWLQESKILNDAYRYLVLNRTDLNKNEYDYSDMVKI
jgi:hypothetical protein